MIDPALVVGVFVGGGSRRMGGRPKGWLAVPGRPREEPRDAGAGKQSVIERTVGLAREIAGEVVLVGNAGAYSRLAMRAIDDAGGGEGPLAGLVGLLDHAGSRRAIAIACDMPHVSRAVLERLATWAPEAIAVAPREGGRWSAMASRWDSQRVLAVARASMLEGAARGGSKGPAALLEALGARELPMTDDERRALRDWDTPEDVARDEEGA